MLASFKSDFYLLRGYLKTFIGVFAFMVVISIVQGNPYMANFYPAFMSVYMPLTLCALGEQSGWETMLLSAPVSRGGIVGGRYLMCLTIDLIGLACSFAVTLFIERSISAENVAALLITVFAVLLCNALFLPVIYKFGSHKARFVFMAFCLVPALAISVLELHDLQSIGQLLESTPVLLALDLGAAALFYVSFLTSRAIYRTKEF